MICPGVECNFGGGGPGTAVPVGMAGGWGKQSSEAVLGFVLRDKSLSSASFGLGRFALGADPVSVIVGVGVGCS